MRSSRLLGGLLLSAMFSIAAHAATVPGAQGVWIQADEAQELRTTGKIQSLCEEIKKDPNSTIMNVRDIDANGATYVFNPAIGKIPQLRMGTIAPTGVFTLTPNFKNQMGDGTVSVSVSGDVLTFTFKSPQGYSIPMNYVRSNVAEVQKYYAAEEACKSAN